ncbi:uncharacterized protein BXIN_1964 [Babesia sp. Xinjiang]|uniref:uncharacterized protein n=1 Tax=Babesia sp. Xinjiang TaxID=462227 RepID=UPI000A257B8F|nr:uncharacterized protein BXIN_1964 [Babesia sp. Xinjiang]ORM40548.1 hypothetical protein BXIN_1964 [Babesia sp. Xinjiang]
MARLSLAATILSLATIFCKCVSGLSATTEYAPSAKIRACIATLELAQTNVVSAWDACGTYIADTDAINHSLFSEIRRLARTPLNVQAPQVPEGSEPPTTLSAADDYLQYIKATIERFQDRVDELQKVIDRVEDAEVRKNMESRVDRAVAMAGIIIDGYLTFLRVSLHSIFSVNALRSLYEFDYVMAVVAGVRDVLKYNTVVFDNEDVTSLAERFDGVTRALNRRVDGEVKLYEKFFPNDTNHILRHVNEESIFLAKPLMAATGASVGVSDV